MNSINKYYALIITLACINISLVDAYNGQYRLRRDNLHVSRSVTSAGSMSKRSYEKLQNTLKAEALKQQDAKKNNVKN